MNPRALFGIMAFAGAALSCSLLVPGSQDVSSPETVVEVLGGEELVLNNVQGGRLVTPEGVEIILPPAAFQNPDPDRSVRILVSVSADEQAVLEEGFAQAGPVYDVRLEGGELQQPVMLSLPIPGGMDVDEILGLTVYDGEAGRWMLVPAAVDEEAGLVSASVSSFSRWSIAHISDVSRHCSFYEMGARCWPEEKGAWLEVTNSHILDRNINPPLPDARYAGYSVNYGVCVVRVDFDDPGSLSTWRAASNMCMTVSDYSSQRTGRDASGRWLLPAGSYELVEYGYVSERNPGNPLYIPAYGENWRALGRIEMRDGQTVRFSNAGEFSGWSGWNSSQPAVAADEQDTRVQPGSAEGPWPSDWIGVWQATARVEEFICPDCHPDADLDELAAFYDGYRHDLYIPEDQSILDHIVEQMNSDRPEGAECSVTLDYPEYLSICPSYEEDMEYWSATQGQRWEGTYDAKSDTFQGRFMFWYDYSGEVVSGTWTAVRD